MSKIKDNILDEIAFREFEREGIIKHSKFLQNEENERAYRQFITSKPKNLNVNSNIRNSMRPDFMRVEHNPFER